MQIICNKYRRGTASGAVWIRDCTFCGRDLGKVGLGMKAEKLAKGSLALVLVAAAVGTMSVGVVHRAAAQTTDQNDWQNQYSWQGKGAATPVATPIAKKSEAVSAVSPPEKTQAAQAPSSAPDSSIEDKRTADQSPAATKFGDVRFVDEITVTATRSPIKAFEYPGMVSVVSRGEIEIQQPSTPDDLLRFMPNVEFIGGPRRTGETPSIRGFSGPDVIILIDGARQNFNSGHDGRFFIDPSLLREVEVLRGPASALYGSGGNGGVIEFRTVTADDFLTEGKKGGYALPAGYQYANLERTATLTTYGMPIDEFDYVASITKRDSGRIRLGHGATLRDTDDDILAGLAKVTVDAGPSNRFDLALNHFSNTAEEPNVGQGAGDHGLVEKDIRASTLRAGWHYDNADNRWLNADFTLYYSAFQADELRLEDADNATAGELLRRDVDTIGVRFDNRSMFGSNDGTSATLLYGFEYYQDDQDGGSASGNRDGVPDAEDSFLGLFMQADMRLDPEFMPGTFIVIPGIRYDNYDAESEIAKPVSRNEVSPRLSVSYLPTDWMQTFVSYGKAFRAPSFDELYLSGIHFQIPLPAQTVSNRFVENPDLRPQITRTLEFGAGLDFQNVFGAGRDRLQVKAAHFVLWGDDFIDLQVDQPDPTACVFSPISNCDGTTTNVNVPNAKMHGTELTAIYETRLTQVTFGYSSITGKDEDTGDYLGVLAPDQYTISINHAVPSIDVYFGWKAIAAAAFTDTNDPAEERAGYFVNDVYVGWQPQSGPLTGLRVDLGVDNIGDIAYSRTFTDADEPGLNIKFQIGWSQNL